MLFTSSLLLIFSAQLSYPDEVDDLLLTRLPDGSLFYQSPQPLPTAAASVAPQAVPPHLPSMSPQLPQPLVHIPQISNPLLPVLYNASANNQVVIDVIENHKLGVSELWLRIYLDIYLSLVCVTTVSALQSNISFINNDSLVVY